MAEYEFLDRRFKERALMFSKSGKPSFSGLYFVSSILQEGVTCFKMFCKRSKSFHVISRFKNKRFTSLHYIDHMLCSIVHADDNKEVLLFQYDLLSGKMYNFKLEDVKCLAYKYSKYKSKMCTNSKHLFVISAIENEINESSLSLSVFHRENLTDSLKKCKQKTFDLSIIKESEIFNYTNLFG